MPKVVHTRLLFWARGMAVFPWLILIHPSRRGDEALLAHERKHCEQMQRIGWPRFWWQYAIDPGFRLEMELEAYRVTLQHRPHALEDIARTLASEYHLDLSVEEARDLLRKPAT